MVVVVQPEGVPALVHHELGQPVGVDLGIVGAQPRGRDDRDAVAEAGQAEDEWLAALEDVLVGEVDLDEGVRGSVSKEQFEGLARVDLPAFVVDRGGEHVFGA